MSAAPPPVCTLLTDFGWSDYYVAALKGVLTSRAPGCRLVDVGHEVAAGDVEGGAWLLAAAAPAFPPGTVHLAVVDPGVGSARRILAARAGGHTFVGPDNGLLVPAIEAAAARGGEAAHIHAVERSELWLPGPGSTFHGRDRFAPTAAALLSGTALSDLGPSIADAVRLDLPAPSRRSEPGSDGLLLEGRVAHIDRFGNLVTDLPEAWLPDADAVPSLTVEVAGRSTRREVTHYAEIPPGEPAWLIGSLGTVEVSLPAASVAEQWRVVRGTTVAVRASDYNETPRGAGAHRAGRAPGKEGAMTRWEYKIINIRSEHYRLDPNAVTELDRYGDDGWELVGLTSVNFKTGATDNIAMVFKRPVED